MDFFLENICDNVGDSQDFDKASLLNIESIQSWHFRYTSGKTFDKYQEIFVISKFSSWNFGNICRQKRGFCPAWDRFGHNYIQLRLCKAVIRWTFGQSVPFFPQISHSYSRQESTALGGQYDGDADDNDADRLVRWFLRITGFDSNITFLSVSPIVSSLKYYF